MDSAWYVAVAARGQKKKGRPKETRYRRITQGNSRRKGADGSGLTTTQCQLKDAENVDIEVSETKASWQGLFYLVKLGSSNLYQADGCWGNGRNNAGDKTKASQT